MEFLSEALKCCPEFGTLDSAVRHGRTPVMATGVTRVHKSNIIHTLPVGARRRALVVVSDEGEAAKVAEDLARLGRRAAVFPARDMTFRSITGISHEYELTRIGVLGEILGGCDTVITSAEALTGFTVPPDVLKSRSLTLSAESQVTLDGLIKLLSSSGYSRSPMVEGKGQFAVRGGILDLFVPTYDHPVRIEFWGDDIDSISFFDIESQRRTQALRSLSLTPAREIVVDDLPALIEKMRAKAKSVSRNNEKASAKIYDDIDALTSGVMIGNLDKYISLVFDEPKTLLNYMEDALIFLYEPSRVYESLRSAAWQRAEDIKALLEEGVLCKGLDTFSLTPAETYARLQAADTILLETFTASAGAVTPKELVNFRLPTLGSFSGLAADLAEDIKSQLSAGNSCVILNGSERAGQALCETLRDYEIAASFHSEVPTDLPEKSVVVTVGGLAGGAVFPEAKLAVFTHSAGAVGKKRRKSFAKKGAAIGSLEELHAGDLVVHSVYGIGVFEGISKIENGGIVKDYIKIKYLKGDILYVPVTQLDLVTRYIGAAENGAVKLNRLGSDQWIKTKQKVRGAVRDMAKELLELYAKRMRQSGFKFSEDTDLQHDFEYHFPFEETEDQLKCVDEIKNDMQRGVPMDRLLCGDVGFGKTEVALRAAFKCICDGKQCALLVPTTILAWQHYQTILQRMEHFAVNVEMLSRFRTAAQQAQIKSKLRRGEIDIIVGTHRLISSDVKFRDLGLLIVDEEQRFGVAQKEKLKSVYPDVDVLTLSATPIPRTLNMAMSGLRDMSVLEEAPNDRHPVQTYVLEYDRSLLIDAIRRELGRGGQVYYIYNKVETISRAAAIISEALPDATVAIAHGKMSEEELSGVWRRLIEHEIDVLVCTTIIETGVDVPNVNTLIIEDADRFGLSQLHQLRGRVGRSSRRAYAYLTYRCGKALTDIAQKRLEAIREYTEFGSGFKIAMRDLEIRGAGNLLGAKQHGQLESVGYDMYIRMLGDAVKAEKGEQVEPECECTVDLHIAAHIPEKYIENLPERLQIYRRIAQIRSEEDSADVIDELIDRFGEPPPEVQGLINIAKLRNRAAALNITEISDKTGDMRVYFSDFRFENISSLIKLYGGRAKIFGSEKPYLSVQRPKSQSAGDALSEFIDRYESVVKNKEV